MDDLAEIGAANHFGYEKMQEESRSRRDIIPVGECIYFDEAYERLAKLQELDLSIINVVNVPSGRTLTAFLPVFAFNVRIFGTLTTVCEKTNNRLFCRLHLPQNDTSLSC